MNRVDSAAVPTSPPPTVQQRPEQPAEQLRYARLLDWGTRAGLLVLVLSFAAYMLGWSEPHVPLHKLPDLWGQPVGRYLALTQSPTGWGWLALAGRSDIAGLLGIVILAGCSVLCLLALVPLYWRGGDKTYAGLCLAEAAVVLLAASGLLSGGH